MKKITRRDFIKATGLMVPGLVLVSQGGCCSYPKKKKYTVEAALFKPKRVSDFIPGSSNDTPGNVGVCLSGGGSIAMVAAMGQLRGLHHLGLLSKVKALSTVSGGSWAATPFIYLPDKFPDRLFLGDFVENPHDLTLSDSPAGTSLNYVAKGNLGYVASQKSMIWENLALQAAELLEKCVPPGRIWNQLIGDNVLKPFGLSSFDSFFTYSKKMAEGILSRNPGLPKTYYTCQDSPGRIKRPFHICNTSMFITPRPGQSIPGKYDLLAPVQCTPFFTGILGKGLGKDTEHLEVGGGAVSSYAFDSTVEEVDKHKHKVKVSQSSTLTLADITGMSSAFYATMFDEIAKPLDPTSLYWPAANVKAGDGSINRFADGGDLEDNGVASILAYEDIDNLVVFVNALNPLSMDKNNGNIIVDTWIPTLFGFMPYQKKEKHGKKAGYIPYTNISTFNITEPNRFYQHNKVFLPQRFNELCEGLWKASECYRYPAVYLQENLEVQQNPWFNVNGGRKVNVLWVHYNPVKHWREQLKCEVQNVLPPVFPGFEITQTHLPRYIINLWAHLTSWIVNQEKEILNSMFKNKVTG